MSLSINTSSYAPAAATTRSVAKTPSASNATTTNVADYTANDQESAAVAFGAAGGTTSSSGTSTATNAPTEPKALPDELTGQTAATTGAASQSTKDQFLKLLVAQIQYQDPLNPQDGTAYISQLAQLSQVEQTSEMNERLADLQEAQASSLRAGYSNLAGTLITARTETVHVPISEGMRFGVNVGADAASVKVEIVNADGETVKTIDLKDCDEGRTDFEWDGTPDAKNGVSKELPPGDYTIKVIASDAKGKVVDASAVIRGVVDSVSYADGSVHLIIGGTSFAPSDIESIDR